MERSKLFGIRSRGIWMMLSVCAAVLASVAQSEWEQVGSTIYGTTVDEEFGESIAISDDGARVAISTSGFNASQGRVAVYERSGSSWTLLGNGFFGDAIGDRLGNGVSLSSDGSRLAIGAHKSDAAASDGGQVRVYEYASGAWSQVGGDINGAVVEEYAGYAVSLSSDGSRVAVGLPYGDVSGSWVGLVRVYEYTNGGWAQLGGDNMAGSVNNDYLGSSVMLSDDGSRVILGSYKADPNAVSKAGVARVFDYSGGAWQQVGADIEGAVEDDYAGYTVAISGDGARIAVAIPLNGGIGKARIYEMSGGSWTQIGSDLSGNTEDAYMGYGLALSQDGSRVVVSEPWNDEASGTYRGRVWVYDLASDGTSWTETASFDGDADNDEFGYAVALSGNGRHLAIGATKEDYGASENLGTTAIYDFNVPTTTAAPTPAPAPVDAGTQSEPSSAIALRASLLAHIAALVFAALVLA